MGVIPKKTENNKRSGGKIKMDVFLPSEEKPLGLDKLRLKILFEQTIAAQLSGLVVAGIFVFLYLDRLNSPFIEFWALTLFLLSAARFACVRYFSHLHVKLGRDFDPAKWENRFALLTLAAGINWGAGICFGVNNPDIYTNSLMAFVVAGITAGAAVAYSSSIKATYAFFIPIAAPFMIKLALVGDHAHYSMAGMILAYSVVFLNLTHKFNKYAISSISLSFQKEQLIDRIRQMQGKAMQSAQMTALGEMSRGMAHEINNPLAIIKVATSTVDDILKTNSNSEVSARFVRYIRSIEKANDRIAKIIRDLQYFAARPEDEAFQQTPLKSILEKALGFYEEKFKNHHINFTIESNNPELIIPCRPFHVAQAIMNLLSNSFDAIHKSKEKWVRLEILERDEKVEISVTDSGRGIPEEIRNRITKPFFTTKDVGKGVGLGLSFVKGVMDSHKGELWIDNACPNTRFVIILPKNRPELRVA